MDLNPKFILVLDIGGGIEGRQELKLGDVVVSKYIQYYEHKKLSAGKEEDRVLPMEQPSFALLEDAAHVGKEWWKIIEVQRPEDKLQVPKKVLGIILSGDKLQGDPDQKPLQHLLDQYPEAVAFAMESAGVAHAAYSNRKSQPGRSVEYLVIRGISDYVNRSKNQNTRDTWREYAAEAAVAFGFNLVQNTLQVSPREVPPKSIDLQHRLNRIGLGPSKQLEQFLTKQLMANKYSDWGIAIDNHIILPGCSAFNQVWDYTRKVTVKIDGTLSGEKARKKIATLLKFDFEDFEKLVEANRKRARRNWTRQP